MPRIGSEIKTERRNPLRSSKPNDSHWRARKTERETEDSAIFGGATQVFEGRGVLLGKLNGGGMSNDRRKQPQCHEIGPECPKEQPLDHRANAAPRIGHFKHIKIDGFEKSQPVGEGFMERHAVHIAEHINDLIKGDDNLELRLQ
eukprot:scaffold240530_cov30-Tisochrysis_lutea.AAC.6